MNNLKDRRSLTSKENGKSGGRPTSLDFSSVARILLKGLQRLAAMDEIRLESTSSLMDRKLRNKSRALCAGFDEVIAQSRSEYLKRLDKISAPNSIEIRNQLRHDLDAISREVREAIRILSVKAEVMLQDADELGIDLNSDIIIQLERISKIEAKSLDKIVELVLGIVEETLDRFGVPLNS